MLAGALLGASSFAGASGAADAPNPIVAENALPGATSGWNEGDWGGDRLEAFGDVLSALPGHRVGLKVSTKPSGLAYEIRVFRLGWYGGAGARLMACLPAPAPGCGGSKPGITQPAPVMDSRGTVRASNWSETDSFTIGDDWVSGYYVVRLRLLDGTARATVPLVVRASSSRARVILVQGSQSTWQAYNPWGGKSLYDPRSVGGRAYAVSFERPFDKDNWNVFDREIQLVRFFEREGYDVAYQTGMDTDTDPSSLVGYSLVVTAGHDEYWSKTQRDAFEAARDRGTSLMFLGANTAYWQVRYEDGGRTVVGYKDAALDPVTDTSLDTTQFRLLVPERPECGLLGVMYQGGTWSAADWGQWRTFTVASEALSDPWFAGTGIAEGHTVPFVGHEWDAQSPGCSHPRGRVLFRYEAGATRETAHVTRYVAPSGARVFAAASTNWSWGLDSYRPPGADPSASADAALQRFMRNVVSDLLQPTAPSNYPPIAGATPSTPAPLTGQSVTLTDTSADQDGSVVGRAWDLDGDGQYDDGTGLTVTVSYATPGARTLRVRVVDDDGAVGIASVVLDVTQASAYLGAIMADNPVGYWRLGEGTGTVAADTAGASNGTYLNGVVLDQPGALLGDPNRAVVLDGSNDTVKMPSVAALNPTAAVSLEAWVRPSSITSTGMTVVRKTNQYELTVTSTGRLSLGLWKGGTRTTVTSPTNAIPTNGWSHVVGTWNGSTAVVYVNGVQRGSAALAGPIASGTNQLYVGSSGGAASFYPGLIDEVAVYASALPVARIEAHYAAARGTPGPAVTLLSPAPGSTMNATPNFGGRAGTQADDLAPVTVRVYSGSSATGSPVATFVTQRHAGASSYSVVATPLAAGTYTAQAVQSDDVGNAGLSAPVTFTVDPSLESTMLVAGDIAACDFTGEELTAQLLDRLPGTVQTTGDNAYVSGTLTEFNTCYDPSWGRHLARTHPGVGDHEYLTPGAAGYFAYFGAAAGDPTKGYYSYDLGSWHVVVLNAQCHQIGGCEPGSPQEQWLRQDLAAHPSFCTVAILDEPRFSSGRSPNEESDSLRMQPLWQALYDANADLVVSGDEHLYERFAPQRPDGTLDTVRGLRQFVVGTGGAWNTDLVAVWPNSEVRNDETWGVLRLTLRSTGYDWTFERAAGETFTDSGSTACHGAAAPDTTPPVVSLTAPVDGSSTGDVTPTFAGAAGTAAGDLGTVSVSVFAGSGVGGSLVQTRSASVSAGSWSVDASPALAAGVYTARASQADAAGNVGFSAPSTFTVVVASYATVVLADGPVGYWRLGEPTGTTAANEIAGGANGTYGQCTLGAAGALANDSNSAVNLGGPSSNLSIASYAGVDVGDGPLTIELWLRRSRTNREEIVVSKGSGGYEVRIAKNGFIEFGRAGGRRIAISSVKISDTTSWHHLVVTRDGAAALIYLDGVDVTGRVTPQSLSSTGSPLVLGAPDGTGFNGSLDEVAIYPTALPAGRIQAHYQAAR